MKRLTIILVLLLMATVAVAKKREHKLLVFDPPRYPFLAVANHVEGTVKLRVVLGPSGKVRSAEVLSGPEPLRQSALDAASQMIFACDDECRTAADSVREVAIKYQIRGKPTEDRQERAHRASDSLIVLTTTPLPKSAGTAP